MDLALRPLFYGNTSDVCGFGKEKGFSLSRKVYTQLPSKVNLNAPHLGRLIAPIIKAIATFEPKYLVQSEDAVSRDHELHLCSNNPQKLLSASEYSMEMDERERSRRMKISRANKGNVPWNKGRRHSAETLQLIRERTKLAMQDPKVKMKLQNLGHAQSEETRIKIGVGVRMGWQRRRKLLMVQEMCFLEWQNLIAEASRKGYDGQDELKWDSYRILDKQLDKEWLESIEKRKTMPRSKGSKRAPKSPEQRRKISEAISAKWADPGYRARVCSALAKYHGSPAGAERNPRRKPSGETPSERRNPVRKKATKLYNSVETENKRLGITRSRRKRNTTPSYRDPLADSKLDLIKKIREQRIAMETKKREATERAKLLTVKAEEAAKALEAVAMNSSLARASLLETRKLIAQASQWIESIERGQFTSSGSIQSTPVIPNGIPNGLANHSDEKQDATNASSILDTREANGTHFLSLSSGSIDDLNLNSSALKNLLDGEEPMPILHNAETISIEGISDHVLPAPQLDSPIKQLETTDLQGNQLIPNGAAECKNLEAKEERFGEETRMNGGSSPSATKATKKWVRGRLVELMED